MSEVEELARRAYTLDMATLEKRPWCAPWESERVENRAAQGLVCLGEPDRESGGAGAEAGASGAQQVATLKRWPWCAP